MKKLLITLTSMFIILFTTGCQDENLTGNLTGQVTDLNGAAIVSAQVIVLSSNGTDEVTTDTTGNYSLSQLPVDESAEITITKNGYITHSASVNLGTDTTYDATLQSEVVVIATGSVKGTITDTAGKALAGARVFTATSETITDESGTYFLEINADENVSVSADFSNYAQNSRVITVEEDGITYLNISLIIVDAVETFDASNGAEIFTKGATISLPSSYTLEDGTPYTGQVTAKISYNRVTTIDGNKAFPGDYTGLQTDGTTTVLQSYGFIDVALSDANGSKLQITEGTTATLTYPMDDNIENTPATIPLWYYDIEQGIWVEDGVATYDVDTNSYSGEVTHFTTWNLDAKVVRATYQSCVVDATGAPVTNAKIKLTTAGWTRTFSNNNAEGIFGFRNAPSGLALSVSASLADYTTAPRTFTLAGGENRNDTTCLKLNVDIASLSTKITGKVVFEDGTPVPNKYVSFRSSSNGYLPSASTDENGTFETTTFLRPADRLVTLSISVNVSGEYQTTTKVFLLDATAQVNDIGNVVIAASHLEGCVVMADGSKFPSRGFNLTVDAPYTYQDYYVDSNGMFSLIFNKDFQEHTLYINNWDNNITASRSIVFDRSNIDLTSSCLQLEAMPAPTPVTVDANITSTDSEKYLAVYFDSRIDYEYPSAYGERIIDGEGYWDYSNSDGGEYIEGNRVLSGSFDITKNGVYLIYQKQDNWSTFNGTISVTVNNEAHTVTIPELLDGEDECSGYDHYGNTWVGFALEVYKGEIKVVELNKRAESGES